MGKETKNLVLEVSSGIVIFTVAAMLVALIVYPKPSVFAGLLLGMVLALAMFFSMAEVLDRSMKNRARLQQAIGKAARRRAHIDAPHARHVLLEVIKGPLQLMPAA